MRNPKWSVQLAIQQQVQREELKEWAQRPESPLPTFKEEQKQKWSEVNKVAFAAQIVKRSISIMTP